MIGAPVVRGTQLTLITQLIHLSDDWYTCCHRYPIDVHHLIDTPEWRLVHLLSEVPISLITWLTHMIGTPVVRGTQSTLITWLTHLSDDWYTCCLRYPADIHHLTDTREWWLVHLLSEVSSWCSLLDWHTWVMIGTPVIRGTQSTLITWLTRLSDDWYTCCHRYPIDAHHPTDTP